MCGRGEGGNIDDLHEGICGRFKEEHGGLRAEHSRDCGRVGGVDMSDNDAIVGGKVFKEAVCAAV